jgi:hypothetical protein
VSECFKTQREGVLDTVRVAFKFKCLTNNPSTVKESEVLFLNIIVLGWVEVNIFKSPKHFVKKFDSSLLGFVSLIILLKIEEVLSVRLIKYLYKRSLLEDFKRLFLEKLFEFVL